ncbi:MAG: hypothetical protein H0U49_05825 [Parachlamydiaceae bacterium]|nr:hypothetical protein [Parachlamydiaceae bacterium]
MSTISTYFTPNSAYRPFERATKQIPFQNRFRILSYDQCEHAWRYLGKISITVRNLLTAATKVPEILAVTGENFTAKVKNISNHLRLFAIVSVPFSLFDMTSAVQKIYKSFQLDDLNGVALGTLSFSIISTDLFDSISTFVNATFALAEFEPIQILSVLSLPLPIALASMGTVSRSVQITNAYRLHKLVCDKLLSKSTYGIKAALKEFLIENLSTDEGSAALSMGKEQKYEISEKKKAAILRFAPKAVTDELEKLLAIVNRQTGVPFTNQQHVQIEKSIDIIQFHLQKKIVLEGIGISANLIILFALGLFTVGATGPIPNLLIALAFIIRFISVLYQDLKVYSSENRFAINQTLRSFS